MADETVNVVIASSTGGNDSADAGKFVKFGADGQLIGSSDGSSPAVHAHANGTGVALLIDQDDPNLDGIVARAASVEVFAIGAAGEIRVGTNPGTAGQVLRSGGPDTNPTWANANAGDVVGPASATDHAIARYDLTTGKLIQNSGITIADGASGSLSGTNTGDQDLSPYQTIAALAADVRAVVLTGLSLASSAAVAATDTILAAFGKLQAFNDLFTTVGLAIARLANPSAVTFLRMNADNTATARTAAEMRTDLGVSRELVSITSNFTTSSATYVDITGLAVTLEANSVYQVTMLTPYQSPALATGAGVSVTMTGSPTPRNASRTMFTTGGVATTLTSNADDNHTINTTVNPANATLGCVMTMTVMTSGSACTIQGRAARGGTAGTITIMGGSSIVATKVS